MVLISVAMNVRAPKPTVDRPAPREAETHRPATMDEVLHAMDRTEAQARPVLEYLRDK